MDLHPAILAAALLITMVSSPCQVSALSYLSQSFAKARNPAQPCDESQCKLPDCRCAGTDIPGGLPVSDTPQIVMISFDDGVRVIDYESYYSPVFSGRKTPNGCPIVLTLFASHNYTDYALVEELYYTHGYEMADHSVTHREPVDWWSSATYEEWTHEIMDEKAILNKWGNVPLDSIQGFRGPFLATSETEIKVLHDNKFAYEASMGSDTAYWPFTLDYKSPICNLPATCPEESYPGLWIVPNLFYQQKNGFPCAMLDACTDPKTEQDWIDFFRDNFNAHYYGNRSPFGIYSHSAWFFQGPERSSAYSAFLNELATMSDVYIVTHSQMLEWVRNPTPLNKIADFAPWQCPERPAPRCDYKSATCNKIYPDQSQLNSCTAPCPPNYPQYGNPDGN